MFYYASICSVVNFVVVAWLGNLSVKDRKRIVSIVNRAAKCIGVKLPTVESAYQRNLLRKAKTIVDSNCHPLFKEFEELPSGRRYRQIASRTNRFKHSFVPQK